MTDKKTVTTLDSILSGQDLTQFKNAVQTWHSLKTTDAKEYRFKLYSIGTALNTLYIKGSEKGMKKPAITDMIRLHFKGLNRFERSELRRLAHNAYDIEAFAIAYECVSTNANRLLQQWKNQVVENIKQEKIKVNKAKGIKIDEDTGEPDTVVNRTQNRVISASNIKEGIAVEEPIRQVSTTDFCLQFNLIHNGFIRRFNANEFNADQLNELERVMSNSIMHMNSTKNIDKVFDTAERKVA